jgi:hypothetical protein
MVPQGHGRMLRHGEIAIAKEWFDNPGIVEAHVSPAMTGRLANAKQPVARPLTTPAVAEPG